MLVVLKVLVTLYVQVMEIVVSAVPVTVTSVVFVRVISVVFVSVTTVVFVIVTAVAFEPGVSVELVGSLLLSAKTLAKLPSIASLLTRFGTRPPFERRMMKIKSKKAIATTKVLSL